MSVDLGPAYATVRPLLSPAAPPLTVDPADFTPRALGRARTRATFTEHFPDVALPDEVVDADVDLWLRRELLRGLLDLELEFDDQVLWGDGNDGATQLTGILGLGVVQQTIYGGSQS